MSRSSKKRRWFKSYASPHYKKLTYGEIFLLPVVIFLTIGIIGNIFFQSSFSRVGFEIFVAIWLFYLAYQHIFNKKTFICFRRISLEALKQYHWPFFRRATHQRQIYEGLIMFFGFVLLVLGMLVIINILS